MIQTRYIGLVKEASLSCRIAVAEAEAKLAQELTALNVARCRLAHRMRKLRTRARRRGFESGRQLGEREIAAILATHKTFADVVTTAQEECGELAVAIAAEIIEADLIPNSLLLTQRVKRALHELLQHHAPRIYVAPSEVDGLRHSLIREPHGTHVTILPDPAIARGDATIETVGGKIHLTWRDQLSRIHERLLKDISTLFKPVSE